MRELLIFLVFVLLTLLMTWPWARFLRDAAPDSGDSYLNAWILWWDYQQTFRDPLNLFQAPLFYPARYALAFSENNYGIALLCFPFFAGGLRPLTVHGLATLLGFTLCGYGAFRLGRTLLGSTGAAWIAGIAFGFALYRFHQLAHLNYLFAGWIPLLLEALVLFLRRRSWRRGLWLGCAFLMNALTCIHWFVLTLVPLALTAAFLLTRYRLWPERAWRERGAVCLACGCLLLLPFLLPYPRAAALYGFVRTPVDAAYYSARPLDWLAGDWHNKLWQGFGPRPDTGERDLFPGALPLLFTLVAVILTTPRQRLSKENVTATHSPPAEATLTEAALTEAPRVEATLIEAPRVEATRTEVSPAETTPVETKPVETTPVEATAIETTPEAATLVEAPPVEATPVEATAVEPASVEPVSDERAAHRWPSAAARFINSQAFRRALDVLMILLFIIALVSVWPGAFYLKRRLLKLLSAEDGSRALALLTLACGLRLCLAYPSWLRPRGDRNLVETLRAARRPEAFGIGLIWTVTGFCGSLGMNFFFHRALFDFVPFFKSIRVPARWAMIAVLGLALLAALGAKLLAEALARRQQTETRRRQTRAAVLSVIFLLFLFEMRAAPLQLIRGDVDPDEVTEQLRRTPMRGGIVHLPAGLQAPLHLYTLRQADHRRPLVTAVSGFAPDFIQELETLANDKRHIPERFLDLLESLPVSYLVVHTGSLMPETRLPTEEMLATALASKRLVYVGRYDGRRSGGDADLYAVARTEPQVEARLPPPLNVQPRSLSEVLSDDPLMLVSEFEQWSYDLYRLFKVSRGRAPRYEEFLETARAVSRDIIIQSKDWEERVRENTRALAEQLTRSKEFESAYARLDDEQYVARLFASAGLAPDPSRREALVRGLAERTLSRADVLRAVVSDEEFIRQERNRAFILMHYFGYLRRNPDDPPDNNMSGFNFWLKELETTGRPERVTAAFMNSGEHQEKSRE